MRYSLALRHPRRKTRVMSAPGPPRLRLRIVFGTDAMLGPGKADLLEGIGRTGSISAAGREMGMSYKRAWMLVEEMNAAFRDPLVTSTRGGPGGGGASLTLAGRDVLGHYRALETAAADAGAARVAALRAMLRDISDGK
jgi:molybdate transport system regulatory protein